MKKITSYILTAVFAISFAVFFNTYVVQAKASAEEAIYNATNTYEVADLDSNPTEETKIQGNIEYRDAQYTIKYDMSEKTDNAVASTTAVTVLTHGYNSSAGDWLNDSENRSFKQEYLI